MSDCSTKAFPNGLWPNEGDCKTCKRNGRCVYQQFGERVKSAKCEYEPSKLYMLQQRYEQLERVAKQMLADLDGIVCYTPYGSAEGINYYRNRLKELGVKIDD